MFFLAFTNLRDFLYSFGCVILVVIILRLLYFSYLHPLAKFPGPVVAKFGDIYWYYALLSGRGPWMNHDWHKKHGMIVRIAPNHLSFSDHHAQKIIYGFGTKQIPSMAKDPRFFTPEVDGSMNIINECNKMEHSRMRRMLSFSFSMSNLLENEDVLIRRTNEFLEAIGTDSRENGMKGVNIVQEFNYVTFNIMGEMSFGDSWEMRLKEQRESRYHWADVIVDTTFMNDVMRAVVCFPGLFSLLEVFKPTHSRNTLYRHAEYATEHTEARLKLHSVRKDFMYHILNSKGPAATPKEIASHFNVIMMAGAVTTATFLSGALYYLCHNRQAMRKLQDEMRRKFASVSAITSKELFDCVYLNAVVEEGLRIYPPAGAAHLSRIVPEGGCRISGEFIPAGTRVSVHPWSVLRDSSNFHAADKFIPERWLSNEDPGQKGDKLERSLPFSYGPRGCLGRNLAYLEMRMVLAKMFWKYDVTWFNADEIDWERDTKGYTLWEKPALRATFKAVAR
ncbi:cytochrome P450 [Amylocarpus encephaloides]|uniref:Cytochrome P450 n=1 Tax=Amylocarpus encephaloides TaxID=45428 RepID=A0A9P7YD34_9HELO|nr:cytochrome P450 [Amylocarpus encephaloides]